MKEQRFDIHQHITNQIVAAIEAAIHYGLYDLDRLERMILRNVATAYFIVPAERLAADPEAADEG